MKTIEKYEIHKVVSEFPKVKIMSSNDAADYIRQFYSNDIEIFESFFILLLNRANVTVGYAKISQGGITGTVVDKKIVGKYILDSLASGVIIAHNHPSGALIPSTADKTVTKNIKEICQLLDTELLDHIILTANSYLSFADENLI